MEGQAEKQAVLAAYCCGTEFRQRIEGMVEPIFALKCELDKERRGMETIWARREKQHQQLEKTLIGLYGDVGSIMGSTLPRLTRLELPPANPELGQAA